MFHNVLTLSILSLVCPLIGVAAPCEKWIETPAAAKLASPAFELHFTSAPASKELKQDWPILCGLILPQSAEPKISKLCVRGSLAAATPFLSELITQDQGIHYSTRINSFKLIAVRDNGLVLDLSTSERTSYTAPAVNCGDVGAPPCPPKPPYNPNCDEDNACDHSVPQEWTTPQLRTILVPRC